MCMLVYVCSCVTCVLVYVCAGLCVYWFMCVLLCVCAGLRVCWFMCVLVYVCAGLCVCWFTCVLVYLCSGLCVCLVYMCGWFTCVLVYVCARVCSRELRIVFLDKFFSFINILNEKETVQRPVQSTESSFDQQFPLCKAKQPKWLASNFTLSERIFHLYAWLSADSCGDQRDITLLVHMLSFRASREKYWDHLRWREHGFILMRDYWSVVIKERSKESWARAKNGVQRTEAICKSREKWPCCLGLFAASVFYRRRFWCQHWAQLCHEQESLVSSLSLRQPGTRDLAASLSLRLWR